MKRLASILIALFAVVALHAEEQPITFGELPKNAKIFVFTYFKDVPFTEVYIERRASLTQYEVRLQDGIELQFDRTGLCTEISSKNGTPTAISASMRTTDACTRLSSTTVSFLPLA